MTVLHLIPVGLSPAPLDAWLPAAAREAAASLRIYIAENAKTARAFLKTIGTHAPLQDIVIHTLRPDTRDDEIRAWLQAIPAGQDIGLVSEAGCPAVADPGAAVVAQAHRMGLRVLPWTGPSSIMLGLMASGLQGQRFAFHGYAPVKPGERDAQLRAWESASHKQQQTQILIETPYRNEAMFEALLRTLRESTRLCVACSLTAENEWIRTLSIAQWRKAPPPDLARKPALFLYLAD
ncbi:SAM-dependent methyltransferase [Castellaniella sp. GW247-6E4]|uniref:SAM-dependent methyltransferase n=1 Tax=Castellaniella sp. GW247-6E4 TaxID=3140380 RepID=UPI003314551E